MPSTNIILVLAVIACAMALFVSEKLRIDLVAMCVLLALLILRLIEPEQALYGFANPATGIIAAMFVLSAGLVRTGLVDWLARQIEKIGGKSQRKLLLVLCLTVAPLSAFVISSAIVAVFIPVCFALAKCYRFPVSRILIPVAFSSQLGGVCTLIGSSTNILIDSIARTNGFKGFEIFEFARLGLVMMAVGLLYILLFSSKLIPKRKGTFQHIDKYRLVDYLAELTVTEESPLIDQKWEEIKDKELRKVELIQLIRGKKAVWKPVKTIIRKGDILLVHSDAARLLKIKNAFNLHTNADAVIDDQKLSSDEVKLIETLIPPSSPLVGRTLQNSDFAKRYGSVALALQRRGKILRERLADIHLDSGDTLLLQCDKEDVRRLLSSRDLIVTNELTELHLRKDRAFIALFLLSLVVGLAAFNVVPILTAALIGAVGMILARCLTLEEAYQAIDWKVIFLFGGMLPLGMALFQTGAASWLANSVLKSVADLGPVAVLAALYLLTAILTELISNVAAAILLAPIAIALASTLGVDPRPFLMAITFAASTSFSTPIGYQTNTMIYAPGGYRFLDFARIGAPLSLMFWFIAILLIPLFWPF
jgi:di/tricarboxylate transporter